MEAAACPICRDSARMKRPKTLYGHQVCRRCWARFMNRRQIAWIVDTIGIGFVVGLFLGLLFPGNADDSSSGVLNLIFVTYFVFKDGFAGQSLGKAMCGVQVVHQDSGEPTGFGRSFLRNWILLLPFVPLVVAFTMGKGPRLGDEMGKTKVIWKRYRDSPVFAPPGAAAKVFE